MSLSQLQEVLGVWSDATFGTPATRGPIPALHHLAKEVDEAIAQPDDVMEYADCLLLLLDAARRAGFTAETLMDAAYEKLAICTTRDYSVRGGNGVIEHVR